jgi:hypothetical protein
VGGTIEATKKTFVDGFVIQQMLNDIEIDVIAREVTVGLLGFINDVEDCIPIKT